MAEGTVTGAAVPFLLAALWGFFTAQHRAPERLRGQRHTHHNPGLFMTLSFTCTRLLGTVYVAWIGMVNYMLPRGIQAKLCPT